MQDFRGKNSIPRKESNVHQQIRRNFKAETSEVLNLEHSLVWCWHLEAPEDRSRSEIPWKIWDMVLE